MPRVLLLDLDDTILSYGEVADGLWHELAERFAPKLGLPAAELGDAVDAARRWFWSDRERDDRGRLDLRWARRRTVDHALRGLGLDRPEVARAYADTFTRVREERVAPFAGAIETLRGWRAAGVRLALCTNGHPEFQRAKIERFALAPFFDAILVEGELGYGKPDARVFRGALDALGAAPGDAWMIGDNLRRDVEGAQRVGLHAVWVDHRRRGLPEGSTIRPNHVVTAIAELAEIDGTG